MIVERTRNLDIDVCLCDSIVGKIRTNDTYAQNFYAALCNRSWYEQDAWEILRDRTWSCSWRYAGSIVADIRGSGDYIDWYCSGMKSGHPDDIDLDLSKDYVPEGTVTDEIRFDLMSIGWYLVEQ
jgi:hypothetical protein